MRPAATRTLSFGTRAIRPMFEFFCYPVTSTPRRHLVFNKHIQSYTVLWVRVAIEQTVFCIAPLISELK